MAQDENGSKQNGASERTNVAAKAKTGTQPLSKECDYIIIPYYLFPGNKLRPVFHEDSAIFPDGFLKMLNSNKPASWDLMRLFHSPPYNLHFGHCELPEVWLQAVEYPPDTPKANRPPFPTATRFRKAETAFSLFEPIYSKKLGIGPHGVPEIMMVIAPPDRFCLPPSMQGCSRLT